MSHTLRLNRRRIIGGLFLAAAVAIVANSTSSSAADPTATAIENGLQSLATATQGLATPPSVDTPDHLSFLGQQIPLTGLSPLSGGGLSLGSLLHQALDATGTDLDSPGALATALNNRHAAFGGVDVTLGCGDGTAVCGHAVTITPTAAGATAYDLTLPFSATRNVDVPLSLPTDAADLNGPASSGGEVRVALTMSSTFTIHYDTTNADLTQRFTLTTPPTLHFSVAASTPTALSFPVDLGFTKVTVSRAASPTPIASLTLDVAFASPHAGGTAQAGKITEYDLQNTALTDYVTVTRGGSVNASIGLDTDLTAANPDATVGVTDTDLSNGFQPQFNGGTGAGASLATAISSLSLSDFTNISPSQVLSGLGQMAASVQALQTAANVHLPLLQNGLADTLKLVDDLVAALAQQTVICGNVDGNPPSGTLFGLAAGTPVFCQATTTDVVNAGSVTWSAVGSTATAVSHTSGAAADNTIGTAPTVRAQFTTNSTNVPPVIIASYTTGSPAVNKGVSQPVPTAQDLLNLVIHNGHFQDPSIPVPGHLPTGVTYDAATHALKFHLLKTLATGVSHNGSIDFGDRFKSATGLFSLSSALDSGGHPTSTVSVNASNAVLDLTFGVILTKDLTDISTHSTPPNFLDRFFVQVGALPALSIDDATVSVATHLTGRIGFLDVTADPPASGTNFSLQRNDPAEPIIKLDVIGHPTDEPLGISVTGGGTIPDSLPIAMLLSHITNHVAITPNIHLSGGIAAKASVGGSELASGGVTFDWPIASMSDLTSATGLVVTPDADFTTGLKKFWDMAQNDPAALLPIILNALSDLANQAATAPGDSGSVLDTQLPLVSTTPRQLLKQFTRLKDAIDELKGGAPAATIACTDVTTPATAAENAAAGDLVRCAATSHGAATTVQWRAFAGTTLISGTTVNDTDALSVSSAPDSSAAHGFTFAVPSGVTGLANLANPGGFRIHVDFDDADGHHTADSPALSSPPTLQALVDALTSKLGLPAGTLTASIASIKKPGEATGTSTLKLGLSYNLCTAGNTHLPACPSGGPGNTIPAISLPLSVDLGPLGGSGNHPIASTTGAVTVEVNGHAQLDLGFPLDFATGVLPTPEVLGTTGATVQAAVDGTAGVQASLGPLSLQLGTTAPNKDGVAGGGTGTIKLGGKVTIGRASAVADQAYTLSDFVSNIHASFGNTDAADGGIHGGQDCGTVDADYTDDGTSGGDPTPPTNLATGAPVVCANVSLGLNNTFLGDVGLAWSGFGSTPTVYYPSNLLSTIESAIFNPDFLLKALPALLTQLQATLSNANGDVKLPVIGDALDAGANIVGQLNDNLVTPVTAGLSAALGAIPDPKAIHDQVQAFMFSKLGPGGANLLLDTDGSGTVDASDVAFNLTCTSPAPANCNGDSTAADLVYITDAVFDFQIGQGIGTNAAGDPSTCKGDTPADTCATPANVPFNIGLDGLPLRIEGALAPHVGWKMRLNFGLSRSDGPYLVTNHKTGSTPTDDLSIGAGVALGDPAAGVCSTGDAQYLNSTVAEFAKYDTTRCLKGTLGFLEVTVRDADGSDAGKHKKTGIDLTAGLRVTSSAGDNGKLTLSNITSIGADFHVKASADANLFVRAGVSGAGAGFPSIAGTFHASFAFGGASGGPLNAANRTMPTLEFDNLYLDVGQLLQKYLKPIVQQVQSVTSPLKPIIDVLQAPIPVVSQLAALVGEPPVTLINLAESASGSDLSVIKSIIDMIQFINNFNFSGQSGLIALGNDAANGGGGSFGLNTAKVDSPQAGTAAGSVVTNPVSSSITGAVAGATNAAPDPVKPGDTRKTTFGVPGLDIPWFNDPSQIFKLLMGQDITLIDYQFGGLHAEAGFQYTFGPFLVGPVPVSIVIGGSVQINGHLGIGYDTTGLREVLDGGGPDKLLDGLFFDTYDSSGHEAPVVQLIGTVTAGAEVDLVVVKAGIEAGLQLTVNFFFDDPTPDGKMSLHDIGSKLDNPICLFKVTGSLDAFLKAFVEIDLFFYSDRFEFTILQLHLLDFSAACSPPKPEPATLVGSTLELNIGPHADRRHYHFDAAKWGDANDSQNKEEVVVRSLPPGNPHQVSVSLFGYYEEYGDSATNTIHAISADGGIGNDKITMQAGSRDTGTITVDSVTRDCTAAKPCNDVPFTLPATVNGGGGDDVIVGGDAADTLNGDGGATPDPAGSDKISGGAGNDTITGGPGGTDNLSGDTGSDHIYGGTLSPGFISGSGPVVIEGGPGADFLYGSNAADNIDGGPGLDPNAIDPLHKPSTFATTQPTAVDGGDVIVGSKGNDSLNGGPGDDIISGDEDLSLDTGCVANGAAPDNSDAANHVTSNDDIIDAGTGNDHVWGGSGSDIVKGGTGSNFICGNAGDDTLEGNPASGSTADHSTIVGGPDQDILSSGPGDSLLIGGSGNDTTTPGAGNDIVIGGLGRDTVSGGLGNDILLGDDGTVGGDDPATLAALSPAALETKISGLQAESLLVRASHVAGSTGSDTGAVLSCTTAYDQLNTTSGNSDCISGSGGGDVVYAGPGADTVSGDDGADYLDGGSGPDTVRGAQMDDYIYGQAGDDSLFGDSGADHIYGGPDQDTIHGGSEADYIEGNGSSDTINGDSGNDNILGGSGSAAAEDKNVGSLGDTILGGEGDDVIVGDNGTINESTRAVVIFDNNDAAVLDEYGNDAIFGNEGSDRLYGGGGVDTVHGNELDDYIEGNSGADNLFGDDGNDRIIGGSSQDAATANDTGDTVHGGLLDDVIIGDNGTISPIGVTTMAVSPSNTFGDDHLYGDQGFDQVYGQLGDDTIYGDTGADYLIGDLGSITVGTAPALWPGNSPHNEVTLISPEEGGIDTMYGGGADDHMYGGAKDDVMQGNSGNDYMEGNNGRDSMYGLNDGTAGDISAAADFLAASGAEGDQDDMLGGSSNVNPEANKQDVGETVMQGNLGADVMIGDNGTITRTVATPTTWATDQITGGIARTVTLFYADRADCSTGVCGGDTMQGDEGNDRMYGEGGDDVVHGNLANDYIEGNQNDDTPAYQAIAGQYGDLLFGDEGEDDITGGSSQIATGSGANATGQPDSGDTISGGADADVIAGDNAILSKVLPGATSADVSKRSGMSNQRNIQLLDLRTNTTLTGGNDLITGDDGVDVVFGQIGDDRLKGNAGDDYVEGGPGIDWVEGNDGDDDLVGGSSFVNGGSGDTRSGLPDVGDRVFGGSGNDLMLGDNAIITRVAPFNDIVSNRLVVKRHLELLDLSNGAGGILTAAPDRSGDDQLSGGSGVDVIFGQDGSDRISGGSEDDYMEGNGGADRMWGDRLLTDATVAPEVPTLIGAWPGAATAAPDLEGVQGAAGQDDQLGGSSIQSFRDADDRIFGDGAADFQLGDNGTVTRVLNPAGTALTYFTTYNPTTVARIPVRFCTKNTTTTVTTCEVAGASGADYMEGNAGDDYMFGQDGNDLMLGGTENDDMYGELGDDQMFGEDGEDAMIGDRGWITDTKVSSASAQVKVTTNGPAFFDYTGLRIGQLDRRVAMDKDVGNVALVHPGYSEGGNDQMRGGRGHDSMHGEQGDDLMNGDSGGDWLFGDDGGDVMWGGKGSDNPATPNARNESTGPNAAVGIPTDNLVDYLFGGYGGSETSVGAEFTGGSDILDWRPRPNVDPVIWFTMTNTGNGLGQDADTTDNQHHQGIDWVYGGFDRDVLQGDVGKNGPDFGDRLMDWDGNFNLFSRCNSSYGDDGDIRQHSPAAQTFLQTLAYGSGAGPLLSEMADPNRVPTGAHELAFVYPGDKGNNGKPYPTSPGHFDTNACALP
ncbi:MAG: Conserved putative secreted protein [Frankiales bacterium]|nr:Conserved putative secreted protein [Frankiales bacterium]